jgi:hypothetical protein
MRGWTYISDSVLLGSLVNETQLVSTPELYQLLCADQAHVAQYSYRVGIFGRASVTRSSTTELFYSSQYTLEKRSHTKNNYCVRFKTAAGSILFGLIQNWCLFYVGDSMQVFANIRSFSVANVASVPHPTIPGASYFPRSAQLPSVLVPVSRILHKAIYLGDLQFQVDGMDAVLMIEFAHFALSAYDDAQACPAETEYTDIQDEIL